MSLSNQIRISTRDVSSTKKQKYWESAVNRYIVNIDCPLQTEHPIEANLLHSELDSLKVNRITASAHSVHRSVPDIAHDSRERVFACLMTKGSGYTYQGTQCIEHVPGDLVIYDILKPYGHGFPDLMEMYVLDLPKARIQADLPSNGNPLRIRPDQTNGDSSTRSILRLLEQTTSSHAQAMLNSEAIIHHIKALVSVAAGKNTSHYLKALYNQCIDYINSHIADENLNANQISDELDVTVRQISRAFEGHGLSLSKYIWHQRLKCSRESLVYEPHLSITEVAFKCGFNHSAHFSRMYKQYFNETPSQTRKKFHH